MVVLGWDERGWGCHGKSLRAGTARGGKSGRVGEKPDGDGAASRYGQARLGMVRRVGEETAR